MRYCNNTKLQSVAGGGTPSLALYIVSIITDKVQLVPIRTRSLIDQSD